MSDDDVDYQKRARGNRAVAIAVVVLVVIGLVVFWAQKRAQDAQDCEFAGHHDCHPIDTGQ